VKWLKLPMAALINEILGRLMLEPDLDHRSLLCVRWRVSLQVSSSSSGSAHYSQQATCIHLMPLALPLHEGVPSGPFRQEGPQKVRSPNAAIRFLYSALATLRGQNDSWRLDVCCAAPGDFISS
jgi:hypothetical protein